MTTNNPDPLEVVEAALCGTGADHHDIEAAAAIIAQHYAPVIAESERLREHISEQITHASARIQDGIEMGAAVWRIALEDIVRENLQALGAKP